MNNFRNFIAAVVLAFVAFFTPMAHARSDFQEANRINGICGNLGDYAAQLRMLVEKKVNEGVESEATIVSNIMVLPDMEAFQGRFKGKLAIALTLAPRDAYMYMWSWCKDDNYDYITK